MATGEWHNLHQATTQKGRRKEGVFGFQRLDVYRAAAQFLGATSNLVTKIPRGNRELIDQLRRAALSVPLNIAEGSGKFNRDALRFYTIARGSALECAAILDALEAMAVLDEAALKDARVLLERVVSMLTGLIRV
jgi:four helix bundle protein